MAWTPIRLLDTIATAPTGAWSTRKLRGAFSGSCLRVRRSSDNAETDIGFDVNGEMDKAAIRAYVGSGNDGFVVTWYDQSGNARNVTQATSADQPQIVDNGALITTINRKASIKFDGSSDVLSYSAVQDLLNTNALTLLSASRASAAGGADSAGYGQNPVVGAAGSLLWQAYGSTKLLLGFADNAGANVVEVTSLTFSVNTNYIMISKYDGTTLSAYKNGGTAGTANDSDGINTGSFAFQIGQAGTGGAFHEGTTAEIIIFDAVLPSAALNTLGADMAERAGTTWSTIS